jgi:hypothetical protein
MTVSWKQKWLLVLSMTVVSTLHAAELRQETICKWDEYIRSADAAMQLRLQPGHPFLWIDEAPDRRRQLRGGEILVNSVGASSMKRVPNGLIHHWMGAAFFPNAKLDDVLGVVRNYAHYKDYYNPNVIDARSIQQTAAADRFSMLLMNKAFFMKTALEGEYQSSYAAAGSHRLYGVATAVRLQEVADYGEASEHRLPANEGSGYIWRMHSITRFEEADGGVYVEIETMALSRDIPAGLRWMVDPIVRRVAKGAMTTSLRQTEDAVSSPSRVAAAPSLSVSAPVAGFVQSFAK